MKLPFNEYFLQFVWQHQYFLHQNLQTSDGEKIEIIHRGYKNTDEGPDFLNARIKIGEIEWAGSVEIHLNSKAWLQHNHQNHPAYNNVILHVVFENSSIENIKRNDGSVIPIVELKGLISDELIQKGNLLFENIAPIPCSPFLSEMDQLTIGSTLDRALTHRLERKSIAVLQMLEANQNDWEETTYQLIAQHFGMKVNNDAFARLASITPLKLLLKHSDNLFSIEALLFGQAGYLEMNQEDDYHQRLKKEYQFLKHKYSLAQQVQIQEWKHLRLRPYNFPPLRIAELAALYHKNGLLHSQLIELNDAKSIKDLFKTSISEYWQHHYGFEKKSKSHLNGIGDLALNNLLINVTAVLLAAYGTYVNNNSYLEKSFEILQNLGAENNKITRAWEELGIKTQNSFDSQALIEKFNTFCTNKACLDCQIGNKILGR